jgi:Tfp pilus assembly protein PilN
MFGKKDYIGFAIQDDVIRVARLRVNGDAPKIVKLDQFSLVEKIKKDTQTKLESDSEDDVSYDEEEADSIFGLEEDEEEEDEDLDLDLSALEEEEFEEGGEDEFAMDMVEESETAQSNELLFYNILSDIGSDKINLGLNIPAGHTIFQVIRETDFNEVKKKDLKEDLENKLNSIYGTPPSSDNYAYEIRDDGSLLLGSVEDESVTLKVLNRARELYTGKLSVQDIVPDEIALVGLVRANYELDPDEMTGIIQFGKESCRVVFIKGEEIWLVSPIINEGTNKKSFKNTIFSKILFQLDTGEVPSLDRILLANNTEGESAVEFFQENFPDINVENLSLKEDFIDTGNIDPASVPAFTTAIGTALAASGTYDEVFPELSFVPKYVADRQKIFQLQWHGMIILALIFLVPITFNYFYQQNVQKIDSLTSELQQLNNNIERINPIVEETRGLEQKIAELKNNLVLLNDLSENTREWSVKLSILNEGIDNVNNSWITSMSQSEGGVSLQGYTLYRNRIPEIVNIFEEATLMNVNNEEIREQRVYRFSISVDKFTASDDIYSPPQPEEVKNLIADN